MTNLGIVFMFLLGLVFIYTELVGVGVFCIAVSVFYGFDKIKKLLNKN